MSVTWTCMKLHDWDLVRGHWGVSLWFCFLASVWSGRCLLRAALKLSMALHKEILFLWWCTHCKQCPRHPFSNGSASAEKRKSLQHPRCCSMSLCDCCVKPKTVFAFYADPTMVGNKKVWKQLDVNTNTDENLQKKTQTRKPSKKHMKHLASLSGHLAHTWPDLATSKPKCQLSAC